MSFSGHIGVSGSKFSCGVFPDIVQIELKVIVLILYDYYFGGVEFDNFEAKWYTKNLGGC